MAEVMLGGELHPDRVIPVEKLYEIFNEYGIPYRFAAQHGIENNSFAVVRCKDCKHCYKSSGSSTGYRCKVWGVYDTDCEVAQEHYCSCGERKDNGRK